MATAQISKAEQLYISTGIEDDIRSDGRMRMDYRNFSIESGVLAQSNGSAMIVLGSSRVLVSVKLEIGIPEPSTPDWGKLECSVEWSRMNAASAGERIDRELFSASLSRQLKRALLPSPGSKKGGLDLSCLNIISGQQCWIVYIDAMILGNGGNLSDAISLGIRAALHNTKIPKTELVPGELDGEMDFELSEDPLDCLRFDLQQVPICVSLTKIGKHFVIDPTPEEEDCMSMQLSVAIDKSGNFCSMSKSGKGAIDPSSLIDMLTSVKKIAKSLLHKIDQVLYEEEKKQSAPLGFFA